MSSWTKREGEDWTKRIPLGCLLIEEGSLAKTLRALINQGDFSAAAQQQYDLHQFLFLPIDQALRRRRRPEEAGRLPKMEVGGGTRR